MLSMTARSRISILFAVLMLVFTAACNHRQVDYQLTYTVTPDTAGHGKENGDSGSGCH